MLDTADSASPNLLSPENGVPVDVESVRNHLSENATSVDARVRYSTKTYRDLTRVIYVCSRHHTYEEVLIGASSILKSPHATTACGAPSRSSDLNGQGRLPLQGGEGDPKPSIRCDREWERFKRIKRRIISCAQLGSRTYERTRTNQEVYYQPTGAKTQ